ncbi:MULTISPECIES: SAV_2336 N-terminal domain-related protein [unclassified Streptomyces]|uniref:SAV_2336 N-terminal domain-related protein n=1 Tax=unclassified Streptomyces TaxID=2593676 RepID=UPI002E80BE59|nr:SAV_2336 N-terminal domain-related protein [Streptomyces sp. NBC_00589]WTI36328.1 SAV_2336 family protein [Streptomyces sp. NBC_00775]WUB29997.1 SAV_2336 family protein [Streptomyces sp. NBC_00589]
MPDAAARHGPDPDPGPDPVEPSGSHPTASGGDRTRSGGDRIRSGGDPIAELIAGMRQIGLDPDAEQLCDTLWLARWARPTDAVEGEEAGRGSTPPSGAPVTGRDLVPERPAPRGAAPVPPGDRPEPPQRDGAADRRVALYPVPRDGAPRGHGQGRVTVLPIGVPAAPAFPAPLELQRALRPLQGYRTGAPPLRTTLDETATAELSARAGGLVLPVFRGVTRADAALQLVMDASSSMRVWDRMFAELEQVFGQLGAFWDIEVSHLHQAPDGEPAVSRSPEPRAAPLHSADRLSDPTGRRITLLVSDCAGPLWHSGHAHRLLYHLSRQGPAAVIQPLPQRMWNRTRLPVSYGELTRGEALAGAATLKVRLPAGTPPEAHAGALPVPVLPPEPAALGAWARLLSGAGAGPVAGAVGWVRHNHPPAPAARPGRRLSALELVSRFRSNASKTAGRLAGYLAAAPLSLPVMQLVQRTMLPDSGPSELAEVLLSGLVSRAKAEDYGADGAQWYEFAPGVQEALLSPLGRDEAMLVLKHCSEYIEYRFGKGGPNFPALALAQLGDGGSGRPYAPGAAYPGENGDNGGATLVPQPFAEVAVRVLERFMPLPEQFALVAGRGRDDPPDERPTHAAVIRARSLVGQFDTDGMVQDLIDAVQLLRGATEHERPAGADPELWAEYANCVLRLWEVQGGAELLREAETAAERAVAHPRALRERAVLARVLHAAATDRRRRGDRRGALDLLQRADREYAVACAAPDLDDREEALRLTLERVRALEAQWRLGGDSALLQGAVGMLEAFADAWPDRRQRPPELPLAHGRVLLRLSGATADHEQARLYAEQGAHSLRAALEPGSGPVLPAAGEPSRVRILLDLVDALLKSGGALDDAQAYVDEALGLTREQGLRAQLLVRAGRIGVARYAESGDPRELQDAAARFEQASRGVPRDAPVHADVLAEWGEALLRRAVPANGAGSRESLSQAIRVLRDCRTETPAGSGELAYRLLLLGRALMLRYRARGDRVDLREAEHLFGLAALEAGEPLTAARCRLELGQAQFEAYQSLGRPARLDEAVDAFRAAAESARAAEEEAETDRRRQEAVELGAQAHHWRGMSYEAAARPRAAREAYRAARAEWSRLPDGAVSTGEPTARQTAQRLAELE